MNAPILIALHWDFEFHVILKHPILLREHCWHKTLRINIINWSFFNFSTMSNKSNNYWMLNIGYCVCLAQILTLITRKLICFLFGPYNVSLSTQKLQILDEIAQWFLLFSKYNFLIVYKHGWFHSIIDVVLRLPNFTKETKILEQMTNATFSTLQLI